MTSVAQGPWKEKRMSPEDNMALVRRWFEEIDRGNLAIIDELLPIDYLDHNPPLPDLPPGREGVRRSAQMLLAAFPDVVHTIEDQVAEGDKVMTRVMTRATFSGEILGFQPTGNVIEIRGIAVHRVAGGRLIEHWAHMDMTGFIEQLGAGQDRQPEHVA
jgi:predicted ester cyclase